MTSLSSSRAPRLQRYPTSSSANVHVSRSRRRPLPPRRDTQPRKGRGGKPLVHARLPTRAMFEHKMQEHGMLLSARRSLSISKKTFHGIFTSRLTAAKTCQASCWSSGATSTQASTFHCTTIATFETLSTRSGIRIHGPVRTGTLTCRGQGAPLSQTSFACSTCWLTVGSMQTGTLSH